MKFIKNNQSVQVVPADFLTEASQKFDISPKVMEQIILRGNDTIEKIDAFLHPSESAFLNPFDLNGMHDLIERIKKAKEAQENVLVFGDYDVDGISATAIMLKALKIFGINAKYYLPNRYVDGYGLTNDVLKKIKRIYNPDLIITVDCGISSYQEVEFARSLDIEVLVTDHHEIPEILPNTIVLNAKIPNQKYGFNGLCGTGLAYKIATALIGKQAEFLLPIACLATIADIVPLLSENRAIVHFGLKKLEQLPIGLKLLFKNLGIKLNNCSATDISFKVAPKLNASGRMGDAQDSLKLYLSEDVAECQKLIAKILEHNDNRKDLCTVVEKDCANILGKVNLTAPSIILSSKDWDHGILGIICSKLVGEYHRPVFLFSEHDGELKGSARSIPGVNIHKLLSSMPEILEVFGGHPVAAGLTIKAKNFDEFVRRVNDYLLKNYTSDVFVPSYTYDIEVNVDELTPKLLKDLLRLEPCGCDNETPKLFLKSNDFTFTPMRNYYNHCNLLIDKKLNLVKFDALTDYSKMKCAKELGIIFELQAGFKASSLRGIVKAIDCELDALTGFEDSEILPCVEQIKYQNVRQRARFETFTSTKDFKIASSFGTAVVVNTQKGFDVFAENFDKNHFVKTDVFAGRENSGLNALIVCPKDISFARFYKKIIFLDPIIDLSYVAKINQISTAEIFVPQQKPNYEFFSSLNSTRENFGKIYKDLSSKKLKFGSFQELYQKLKGKKEQFYTFHEMYSAICVFEELGLIEITNTVPYELNIKTGQKTVLTNSRIYRRIQAGLKVGGK
ncbi:MAG: single-stranded-DNA-specific exonuclease RecJ [Clostridia bacterium]|nr:single-stranded-DNA-specific exonuclease RecJ [Clostridia bacterium]